MVEREPQFLTVSTGGKSRKIAYLIDPAEHRGGPGLIWMPGLKSDMISTKAAALAEWAAGRGLGMTRFDYSGHGRS